MKLNTKIQYGLRALIEIAMQTDKKGMLQKNIAKNQEIPVKYLDVIIYCLKNAGLIINSGGKRSGYILKKPPKKITMLEIYQAFEEEPFITHCIKKPEFCKKIKSCAIIEYWCGLNNSIIEYLQRTTLKSLIMRAKELNS